jgi:hypothetical protein
MSTPIAKLISDIVLKCLKHKISFKLISKPFVEANNIKCSGYFDEEDLELTVATDKKENDWLIILIHESCHLDQYTQKTPIWTQGEDGIGVIDEWLEGKEYKPQQLEKSFIDTIKLEIDCEKRSVKKIKKYNLPIDTDLYIQKANAYLISYWATYRDRKWSPFPYNNPAIYKNMPKRFLPIKEYLHKTHPLLKFYTDEKNN